MSLVRSLVLVVCAVAAAVGSPAVAFGQSGRVDTVVVRDSSGGAVEGAIVVLTRGKTERRLTTPVDGVARFTGIERGEWTLEVRKEGFEIAARSVTLGEPPETLERPHAPAGFIDMVPVTAKSSALDSTPTSASRLELSLRELPATLNA